MKISYDAEVDALSITFLEHSINNFHDDSKGALYTI